MRVPRKKKKQAKKLKAKHDVVVFAMAAMTGASGMVQLATIGSSLEPVPVRIARASVTAIESAQAVQRCMAQIKPWTHFVNYKRNIV
jgi:hypothetical protein